MNSKRIVVVGSANQDYLVRVPRTPRGGETAIASRLDKQPGGKGANQAVAAARLGGSVDFVGAVGRDDDGARILRSLQKDGVAIDDVQIVDGHPTGLALISVGDDGENSITVVSGANETVTTQRVTAAVERLGGSSAIVVLQGELPVAVVEAAARAAGERGARVILNLAPFSPLASDVLALADPLVVNEVEAAQLLGRPLTGVDQALSAVGELGAVARSAVITLGGLGAVWATFEASESAAADGSAPQASGEGAGSAGGSGIGHHAAAAPAEVVDTTGAGDAFVGALAFSLALENDLGRAVELGTKAGTFAIKATGAQSSYARPADVGVGVGGDW